MIWVLFKLFACEAGDPCAAMCSASTRVYGACLEQWEASWEAAGHADARAYFHSCETWAWEMRLLERHAKKEGQSQHTGAVDSVCQQHEADLLESSDPCATWVDFDWENQPW